MKLPLLTAVAFGLSVDAHAIMQVREISAQDSLPMASEHTRTGDIFG